ncbi:unnamed protein product [Nezara viridula]|uniref:Uncharacterized protein n=1 Tax=Nezara viridula TaxID=85310 RepID=A0A9P0H998_NEZVI|nr:unnamed protein product [Nezara viridula]
MFTMLGCHGDDLSRTPEWWSHAAEVARLLAPDSLAPALSSNLPPFYPRVSYLSVGGLHQPLRQRGRHDDREVVQVTRLGAESFTHLHKDLGCASSDVTSCLQLPSCLSSVLCLLLALWIGCRSNPTETGLSASTKEGKTKRMQCRINSEAKGGAEGQASAVELSRISLTLLSLVNDLQQPSLQAGCLVVALSCKAAS